MFEITVITVTNLHFDSSELLATSGILFGTWWAWRSRPGLVRVATALRRHSLSGSCQKPAERLPGPPVLLTLPEPQEAPRQLP